MILITGSTGFVGRHLVKRLVAEGEQPRCLVRSQQKAANSLPIDKITVAIGDTTRFDTLEPAMQGIDTVVHSAFITADVKEGRGVSYQAVNVEGTRNVVEAAQRAGVKKIVVVSGLGTRPDKPGSYMQGRYLAEQYVKESGLGVVYYPTVRSIWRAGCLLQRDGRLDSQRANRPHHRNQPAEVSAHLGRRCRAVPHQANPRSEPQ